MHDGRAGNLRQAQALACALDPAASDLRVEAGMLARWLAPRRWPGLSAPFGPGFRAACASPPALAIGCGRQAALATRLLRERGSRVVQLLDPRIDTRHWNLVVAPAHDALRGDNVIAMTGSLHPVDDAWLAHAAAQWPALAGLPSPRLVLLVGGPTRHAALTDAAFARLLAELAAQASTSGGSLSVTASRRTPAAWRAAIAGIDPGLPGLRWTGVADGENPYAGLLAHAERIVCTPDSVNMLSEAVATRAPVFAWSADSATGRLRVFLDTLRASGRVRDVDDALAPFAATPLRETARVAEEVRRRLTAAAQPARFTAT